MKLFVFGSTGDLVRRKVFPALEKENIPDLEIYAIGRKDFNDIQFLEYACKNINLNFKEKIRYIRIDFKKEDFNILLPHLDINKINYFYISLPPESIDDILYYLKNIKNKGFKIKILMEKPFGKSLEHANILKDIIINGNLEKDFFISDHYLFKEGIFELKNKNFKKLKIVSIEKVGLEGRIGYYDDVGALKDMIQSHFINVLLRINKIKDIETLKFNEKHFGQYGNGVDYGYVKELGKNSYTETYVDLKFKYDNKEVQFITGKRFDKKQTFLEIDDKKIIIDEDNPYGKLFKKFFNNKNEYFPTIDDSILAWKIISKLNKENLFFYPEGVNIEDINNYYNK
ncbi:MAG: hypothetical protein WC867_02130 [Candidatus Pacearchaeota archaeon]|jgi:glucose-6-phosphate 1-dehydrogenase